MSATEKPRSLVLTAPLSGWSTPLDEVPDPVFAGRMLGDGVAIDPTGATLHAPCDAEIVMLPDSMHAVTLRSACGAEILMHIGIDTVALAGEGFQAHVKPGQRVAAGERLITFDLDLLARRAKSLLTPILLLEGSGFTISRSIESRELVAGDVLMEVIQAGVVRERGKDRQGSEQAGKEPREEAREVRRVRVALEHGIHARPAAQIVSALQGVAGEVTLGAQGRTVNARSTVALMKLGVRKDQEVEVRASGKDAAAALAAVAAVLAGAREAGGQISAVARQPPIHPRGEAPRAGVTPASMSAGVVDVRAGTTLSGVVASRGLAVGQAVPLVTREMDVAQAGAGITHETSELQRARDQVRALLESARASASATAREIVDAHLALLGDPELTESALALITEGASAAFAWRQAIRGSIEALRALGDQRMAERVDDLLDLERQVLMALSGTTAALALELPPDAILVAEELLPSQLVALDATRLAGICL
ncbi:MAG: glucose PTS transporter subunit IIA, partial [Acetobacteraceae bacterium]